MLNNKKRMTDKNRKVVNEKWKNRAVRELKIVRNKRVMAVR